MDFQTSIRLCCYYAIDNRDKIPQRFFTTIAAHEGKQTGLDFIPFAGSSGRWETDILRFNSVASFGKSIFHKRTPTPAPWDPLQSAGIGTAFPSQLIPVSALLS